MSFGDREDELWEAMKPSFKTRLVSDPNIKYAKQLVNQTGPFATRGALTSLGRTDVRATRARVVRRAPEVPVTVTGRRKGAENDRTSAGWGQGGYGRVEHGGRGC